MNLLVFIACTYLLSSSAAEELQQSMECPYISTGVYPDCKCKHGPAYDNETNTCPNPECPVNESVGIYPNCTCQQKNFDFSITFNECFRVCPENSNGYWPKCNCDFGFLFRKNIFDCIACPKDSTGNYPNCTCVDDGASYDTLSNFCRKCTGGSFGKYPHCTCSDGYEYEFLYRCVESMKCPYRSGGKYPNCICDGKSIYIQSRNLCIECPSYGVYPNCICHEYKSTYIRDSNQCYTCPANSMGKYPKCACKNPFHQYVQEENICVGCPKNSVGFYPHCKCNGYFSQRHKSCIECPADATGIYPACTCNDESSIFSAFINQCYLGCPENSSGIQPECECDRGYYYDADDVECKSNTGRICPFDSIGTGPDCLCVRKHYSLFDELRWRCIRDAGFNSGGVGGAGSVTCPGGKGKWPQCEASIDFNVLRSAVG